jgi:hypothetical protein
MSTQEFYSIDSTNWWTGEYALEVQQPWSRFLLEGKKTIEARAYPLPEPLIGRRILLLESEDQSSSHSALPDRFQTSRIVGSVIFSRVHIYSSAEEFCADERSHRVPATSAFGWKENTERLYGWQISFATKFVERVDPVWVERRMRSLFEILSDDDSNGRTWQKLFRTALHAWLESSIDEQEAK